MVSHLDIYPTICDLAGIETPDVARGHLADAAGPRRARPGPRRDLHRDDLPRRLPAAARDPHRALEVHPPVRRRRRSRCSPTATTAPSKDLLVEHGWARPPLRPGAALRPRTSTRTRAATCAADPANDAGARRAPAAARGMDGRARRPAARRAVPPPPGARDQRSATRSRPTSRPRVAQGGSHGRAIQVTQSHSRPGGRRLARARPVLERAQAAVEAAQLPQARAPGRGEVVAEQAVDEEEAQEDPVADREHPIGPGLEQRALTRSTRATSIARTTRRPAGAKPGSSGCAAIHSDQRRSALLLAGSSP